MATYSLPIVPNLAESFIQNETAQWQNTDLTNHQNQEQLETVYLPTQQTDVARQEQNSGDTLAVYEDSDLDKRGVERFRDNTERFNLAEENNESVSDQPSENANQIEEEKNIDVEGSSVREETISTQPQFEQQTDVAKASGEASITGSVSADSEAEDGSIKSDVFDESEKQFEKSDKIEDELDYDDACQEVVFTENYLAIYNFRRKKDFQKGAK